MSKPEDKVPNILRPDGTVDIAAAARAPYQILASGGASFSQNRSWWVAVLLLAIIALSLIK